MNDPIQVPSDLSVSPSQLGASSRIGTFIKRDDADVGAMPASAPQALTETREPPDSQYLTTGLPSGCKLYAGFTDNVMHVRRFSVDEALKIYDARAESSLRMLVEAVGATLDNFSVWDLTVGDFWFLMYWHRLHSYPKSPFIVNWTCGHEQHLQKVRNKELEVETLNQEMVLRQSDLRISALNFEASEALHKAITDEYGVTVTVMRMGDFVRIVEMEDEDSEAVRDTEERDEEGKLLKKGKPLYKPSDYLVARHAANLSRVHSESLDERIKALKALNDVSLWKKLDEYLLVADHGVVETFKVKCKACSHSTEVEVALDAMTFLPEL